MEIPKGCDIQLPTHNNNKIELHVTGVVTTQVAARQLIACIKQAMRALDPGEKKTRQRKKTTE